MKQLISTLFLSLIVLSAQAGAEIGKTYRVFSKKYPTKSLFIKNSSPDASVDVVLWVETDVPAQQWTLQEITDSTVAFSSVYNGYYASPSSKRAGGILRMNRAMRNAQIKLSAVDASANIYRITTTDGLLYLAASEGTNGETPAWAEPDETDECMQWVLEEVEPKSAFTAAIRDEMMDTYVKMRTTSKGSSLRTFGNGGWGEAEQLEVALDAYESTGKETYLNLAKYVYNYFNQQVGSNWDKLVYTDAYHWFGHDFNDDVMWQIIAVARLGWLTGTKTYTNAAKKNFDIIYERAFIEGLGMMRWAQNSGDAYGTTTYVSLWLNLPHREIAEDEFAVPWFPERCRFSTTQLHRYLRSADGTDAWSRFFQPQISISMESHAWLCRPDPPPLGLADLIS